MAVDRILRADWPKRDHVQKAVGEGDDCGGTQGDSRAEPGGADSARGGQLRLPSRAGHTGTGRRTRHQVRLHPTVFADVERNRTAVEGYQARDFTYDLRGQRSLQRVPHRDVPPVELPTELRCWLDRYVHPKWSDVTLTTQRRSRKELSDFPV